MWIIYLAAWLVVVSFFAQGVQNIRKKIEEDEDLKKYPLFDEKNICSVCRYIYNNPLAARDCEEMHRTKVKY